MARSTDDEKAKKGGLFDDLSMAQVVAGALAAVTSMLLASQIGIYGSVIGVGVGSVVSAVASQLYKKFFTASAEKLRELKPGETGYVPPVGEDAKSVATGRSADGTVPIEAPRRSHTPRADDADMRSDPSVQRARERRDRKKKLQRGVVAVSVVSAIAAVVLSALVIDLLTTGQGVGAKTQPLIPSSSQAQKSESPADGNDSNAPADETAPSGSKDPSASDPPADAPSSGASSDDGSSAGGDQGSSGSTGSLGSGDSSGSSGSSGGSGAGGAGGSGSSSGDQSGSGSHDSASQPDSGGSASGSTRSSGNVATSGVPAVAKSSVGNR